MPGAFKLDHLQPVKPTLFSKFYNFFTFILGAISYYPRGLILRKKKFSQPQKWTRQRGLSAWGIQIGPFAACQANFIFQILQLFHFHTGGHFLLPQRDNTEKREFFQLQNWMIQRGLGALEFSQLQNWTTQRGLSALGIQTGSFAPC